MKHAQDNGHEQVYESIGSKSSMYTNFKNISDDKLKLKRFSINS